MTLVNETNAQELEVHKWYIDASELEIKPGAAYPAELKTNLGNGQPFVFQAFDNNGTAAYSQAAGCLTLKVWND